MGRREKQKLFLYFDVCTGTEIDRDISIPGAVENVHHADKPRGKKGTWKDSVMEK